jgi:DNA-binding NtrC family response regulator
MQTVLVIDDDTALRDTIGLMLETEGFRPALAEDGKAGIKQAMALKPDLGGSAHAWLERDRSVQANARRRHEDPLDRPERHRR